MFQKRFFESEEWEEIQEYEARLYLEGYYYDVDLAIEELKKGAVLRTPWSFYRWVEV